MATTSTDVDDYLDSFPAPVRTVLAEVRHRIHAAAPAVTESLGYGIARFSLGDRYLVYLAGWKHHVSLYPMPELPDPLEAEIAPYRSGRSTVKLLLRDEVPYDLLERAVAEVARGRG